MQYQRQTGKMIRRIFQLLFFFLITVSVSAQKYETKTFTEAGYTYQAVEGDPTETRIYTLKNGMKVYLSVYRDLPQIFTLIPVRAGSKNDPSDNTGLAHYLEHMVFKGTSQIGAKEYAKEKVLLDSIERMYNRYRRLKDPVKRKALYKQIDKVSFEASKLCYANEYDKMVGMIGAKGTNAFTSNEQTVYMNSIPANQLEKWLVIERERFSKLVPRLFHTELEAVYEEKNMSLDSDGDKVQETLFANLYKKHPYGTQTTIGTVEHLKNPSITEIKKFFNTYYVPNNMAICLAGDLDPNRTIRLIDSTFGNMPSRPVPVWKAPVEAPITQPIIKKVLGPSEESVMIGFRLPGYGTRESLLAGLVDQMLQNQQAGLIDLNLNQKQLVLGAGTYLDENKDYSTHIFYGSPREKQSLAAVRNLILAQLDSIKQGKFEDWLIPAIVNNIKINELRQFDNNQGRAFAQMTAFILDANWADVWKETDQLKSVTKQEIMNFVRQYYGNQYVSVEKITGKDPNPIKISKPSITPNFLNKDGSSDFYKSVAGKKSPLLEPQFLDYSKDLNHFIWKPGVEVLYKKNKSTPLFQLTYLVEFGELNDRKMELAGRFLDLCGAGNKDGNQFKIELFKLGTEITFQSSNDQCYVTVKGLQENFEPSVKLLDQLLTQPTGSKEDLAVLVDGLIKERENQKLDKGYILQAGLSQYAKFGKESPAHFILKNSELSSVTKDELLAFIRSLSSYEHKILYYGPAEENEMLASLEKVRPTPAQLIPVPAKKKFNELATDSNKVYWFDYDMVQTELLFISKSVAYDSTQVVLANLYNEYMGGNMSSVVFQELRESKALAYGAYAGYNLASEKGKPNYMTSYIGCQADKLPEAMVSMLDVLENIPLKEASLNLNKESIQTSLRSERVTKASVLFSYLAARKKGLNSDIRKLVFEKTPGLTLEDLKRFQETYVKGRKYTLVMIGKKDKINFDALRKFGPVQELKPSDIFGF